ncbi:DUF1735 domain-containing protein [Sediminibacterium ginsengisoli]|uniref:BT-3987-like N-terminal domain-containing protein n=1 Tax=Sediminibacterium ginsengisoli TaxID=413434 RepID=A0A1T4RVB9_9BACT|nr:DUF1735 domain-containing protein [Sediminibacterium ginsengisoli]SKA19939.1 protein of unknown function [Sediminibacterium ginsengisoli]
MKLFGKLVAVCAVASGLTGCLKDSSLMDPSKTHNVIEFANTAGIATSVVGNIYPLYNINILMQPTGTYNAIVSYSGADNAPEDITVEVAVADQAVIDKYNSQNTKTFTMLPSTMFSIPATKVVIPKGRRQVNLPITLTNTDQLWGKTYVLPLTIKSASMGVISGNFNTIIYALNGINRLDGTYTLKFRFGTNDRGYDVNTTTWYYSDVQLVTASTTTSTMRNLNAGTSVTAAVHAAVTTAGLPSSIAALVPLLTYDLSTNKITNISNNTAGAKTVVPNPAVTDNRVDPATGNVYASFILKESGRTDMIINDTLMYKSPR